LEGRGGGKKKQRGRRERGGRGRYIKGGEMKIEDRARGRG